LAALLLALLAPPPLPAQTLSGATVRPGQTSLTLPDGAGIYIYAMGTGGGRPSANFAQGPYAGVVDAAGYTVAGLAITPSPENSFSTETDYHTTGGIAVSGFKTVRPYYGSSAIAGATSAAVHFVVSDPAVVVVIGIAGGETNLELVGLPGLQIDAQAANRSGVIPIVIAHTTLGPGEYDVSEQTSGNPAQDPNHMGDLIGAFVFMGGAGAASPTPLSTAPVIASVSPIAPQPVQTILIKGYGFGTGAPYTNGNSPYLAIGDNTARMEAGHEGDAVTLNVARWTDTEIEVTGFSGAYGMGTWVLNAGDQVTVRVWNAQTGAGPAAYDLVVGAAAGYTPSRTPPSSAPPPGRLPTDTRIVTVTVPAQAGPWDPALNPLFDYGEHDQAPPVTISNLAGVPLAPGTALRLRYLTGTVSVGAGWPSADASGDAQVPLTSTSPRSYPSRYLAATAYPVNLGSLIGVFARDGTIVGHPFKVGNGPLAVVVPTGANQLLLGVNDDHFGDNSGAWTVEVALSSAGGGLSAGTIALGTGVLLCVVGVVVFMVFKRPTAAGPAPAVTTQAPSTLMPHRVETTTPPRPAVPIAASSSDVLDKLAKLKSLLDAGLITAEEFREQKAKLLGQMR
jgi:hypothetical protein